ncbi:hypothetical protein DVJ83_09360 [Deinococcus wulumuqiensis]|uniref:Uncharacterized protein n=1 Tax=Deinococcus wulumuqiensis TaxID=980427 RepID=A0A345IHZ2_9DEIO|nr:hypothetical protein DVJ83_09360 [Deinococcus wulumuqiensis]
MWAGAAGGASSDTDSASFLHSRESAACASISRNPYFFLLASARIESETTRFNRNPYDPSSSGNSQGRYEHARWPLALT